jgi:Na+/melibiose symporter-like transporter
LKRPASEIKARAQDDDFSTLEKATTMTIQRTTSRTLTVVSLVLGLLAFALAVLPLRMFSLIPGTAGLILSSAALFLERRNRSGKIFIVAVWAFSVLSIIAAVSAQLIVKDRLAEDQKFENTIKNAKSDAEKDLDKALKNAIKR